MSDRKGITRPDAVRVLREEIAMGREFSSYQALRSFCRDQLRDEWPDTYPLESTYAVIAAHAINVLLDSGELSSLESGGYRRAA